MKTLKLKSLKSLDNVNTATVENESNTCKEVHLMAKEISTIKVPAPVKYKEYTEGERK